MTENAFRLNFNKSLLTNLIACAFVIFSFVIQDPRAQAILSNVGFFALSGALTNWIAVHMLFERVPGFYGSGVIERRFEDLKHAIRKLIQDQFFSKEQISGILEKETSAFSTQLEKLADNLDYEALYHGLIEGIMGSSLGGMLQMIGGQSALEPMKEKVIEKMHLTFANHLKDDNFQQKLRTSLQSEGLIEQFTQDLEHLIASKLDQMTPRMVKMIMKQMIEKHLGWLIVWGGVFGGLIGLVKSFIT